MIGQTKVYVFENIKSSKYKLVEVDTILKAIQDCTFKEQVDKVAAETDDDKQKPLKGELRSICFSASEFSDIKKGRTLRHNENVVVHSGFCVLDFDKLEDPIAKREELKKYNFVYAAFLSPSYKGVKALVRIPKEVHKHTWYYDALLKKFPNHDSTSRNISRVCYISSDKDIYINKDAVEFTEFIEPKKKYESLNKSVQNSINTNYSKLNIAAKMIQDAVDGEKHQVLIKASKLMGGFISSGLVNESDALMVLENEIRKKNISDFDSARKTISDGIEYGKSEPIFETEEFRTYSPNNKFTQPRIAEVSKIEESDNDYSFLADEDDANSYMEQKRNGTFKFGNTTGFPRFDEYYRNKDANLDIVLGHDNVGKSVVSWYLSVLNCLLNDASYIVFAGENKIGGVKSKLCEFYAFIPIERMTESKYAESKKWVEDHYIFLRNDEAFTYMDMMMIGKKVSKLRKITNFIIEPYNVLDKTTTNEHQYDYKAMIDLRLFIRQTGIGVMLNVHAATEALRKLYPKEHDYAGYAMPPNKADTEGGGKFPNKADNFLVVHRMADHPDQWMWTEIHVQKIKEMETGGRRTIKNQPFKIRMVNHGCGFEDEYGFNPIKAYWESKAPIQQVNDFPPPIVHSREAYRLENLNKDEAPF